MGPGGVQNRVKMEANSMNHLKWPTDHFQNAKVWKGASIFHDFWVPSGAQKSTKKSIVEKIEVPGQQFSRFLLARVLQPTFSSIFHRFLIEKSLFFHSFFQDFLAMFWTLRPSRNIDIYISKHTFSFFDFLIF